MCTDSYTDMMASLSRNSPPVVIKLTQIDFDTAWYLSHQVNFIEVKCYNI